MVVRRYLHCPSHSKTLLLRSPSIATHPSMGSMTHRVSSGTACDIRTPEHRSAPSCPAHTPTQCPITWRRAILLASAILCWHDSTRADPGPHPCQHADHCWRPRPHTRSRRGCQQWSVDLADQCWRARQHIRSHCGHQQWSADLADHCSRPRPHTRSRRRRKQWCADLADQCWRLRPHTRSRRGHQQWSADLADQCWRTRPFNKINLAPMGNGLMKRTGNTRYGVDGCALCPSAPRRSRSSHTSGKGKSRRWRNVLLLHVFDSGTNSPDLVSSEYPVVANPSADHRWTQHHPMARHPRRVDCARGGCAIASVPPTAVCWGRSRGSGQSERPTPCRRALVGPSLPCLTAPPYPST